MPQGSRTAKGQSISNLVDFSPGERVKSLLPVDKFEKENFIILLTEKGIVKKTSLEAFFLDLVHLD